MAATLVIDGAECLGNQWTISSLGRFVDFVWKLGTGRRALTPDM
jgi:hypothetical protein